MSREDGSGRDDLQTWTNESVGLLVELPGTSKRVSWQSEVNVGKQVDSSSQYKDIRSIRSNKSHLSAEYGHVNGIPVIPLPARYKPWDQRGVSGPLQQSVKTHLYPYPRFGKPPPPPGRPKSPTCAPNLTKGTLRQPHDQLLNLNDIMDTPNYGWVKYMDPSSGWPYYYNRFTHQSTYDKPPVYQSTNAKNKEHDSVAVDIPETEEYRNFFYPPLDGIWVEYWDEEVEANYYYNQLTGEASWVNPDSVTADNSAP